MATTSAALWARTMRPSRAQSARCAFAYRSPSSRPRPNAVGDDRVTASGHRSRYAGCRAQVRMDELDGHRALADGGRRSAWSSRSGRRRRRRCPGRSSRAGTRAGRGAGEDEAVLVAGDASPSQSVHGRAPRKRNRNENGTRSPRVSVTASRCPSCSVQLGDLAAVADGDAVALELADQVVRHRLAQVRRAGAAG